MKKIRNMDGICYNRLWKLLIDRGMTRTQMRLAAGIQAAAKKQKTGRTALRAVLLRALAELDGTEVRT